MRTSHRSTIAVLLVAMAGAIATTSAFADGATRADRSKAKSDQVRSTAVDKRSAEGVGGVSTDAHRFQEKVGDPGQHDNCDGTGPCDGDPHHGHDDCGKTGTCGGEPENGGAGKTGDAGTTTQPAPTSEASDCPGPNCPNYHETSRKAGDADNQSGSTRATHRLRTDVRKSPFDKDTGDPAAQPAQQVQH